MRVTCFGEAVDKFHDVIQPGNVYLISKGQLKAANKARLQRGLSFKEASLALDSRVFASLDSRADRWRCAHWRCERWLARAVSGFATFQPISQHKPCGRPPRKCSEPLPLKFPAPPVCLRLDLCAQRFNHFPHEYELHLDKNSQLEPVEGDGGLNLPRVTYKVR